MFFLKRYWKYLFRIFSVVAVFAFIVSFIVDPSFWSPKAVDARVNFGDNNGYYTKLCGDFNKPGGDINGVDGPHACQSKCDLGSGTCNGNSVYRFECDGKQTNCTSSSSGSSTNQSLNRSGLCNKTVQIDVYRRDCLASGDCNNKPSFDPDADLQDFIVWYSGDCGLPPAPPAPTQVFCNDGQVSVNASPNQVNVGQSINLSISGNASTFVGDNFGGLSNCSGSWNGTGDFWNGFCTASQPGTFTWTHTWQHCEGDTNHCSGVCSKQASFSVNSIPTPTPTPTPTPSPTPTPPVSPSPTPTPTPTPTPGPTSSPTPSPTPTPPVGGPTCPAGSTAEMRNNVLVCVINTVTNNPTVTNTITNNPVNTVTVNTPPAVIQTFGNVGVATTPAVAGQVLGVKELPKTGLPAIAWSALAFIPAGFRMKGFRKIKKELEDDPQFIWEDRKFKVG